MTMGRRDDLIRFYSILDRLEEAIGGERKLAGCTARSGWPARGVYFFRETGEMRSDTGDGPRIVRVGTHALRANVGTTLWARLSQHKGRAPSGSGNHRGSIFRLIVGAALIRRHAYDYPTWGDKTMARAIVKEGERELEREVSRVIGDMSFLWLSIADVAGPESMRGYIERNAIALLSNYRKPPLDPPSPGWLAQSCDREKVRASGLWNSDHVEDACDPASLDRLDDAVASAARAA